MSTEDLTSGEAAGAKKSKRLRIGLVATDPLRVLGLQTIFSGAGDLEIVPLSVPGVLGAADLAIVLVDAGCTDHLLELVRMFRRVKPQARLIVIGESRESKYMQDVIGAGARGYLLHTVSESEIRMALQVVEDGSVWAPRKVLARLLDEKRGEAVSAEVRFTAREIEILRLLVGGMGNRQIAEELGIDVTTVKAHLTRLMRKTGASNRIELSLAALKRDLEEPAPFTS